MCPQLKAFLLVVFRPCLQQGFNLLEAGQVELVVAGADAGLAVAAVTGHHGLEPEMLEHHANDRGGLHTRADSEVKAEFDFLGMSLAALDEGFDLWAVFGPVIT